LIASPPHSAESPATVFKRLSALIPCPPRNCPPSSENMPREGWPAANSLCSPSSVGSVAVRFGDRGAGGSAPSASRSTCVASLLPGFFLKSPMIFSWSAFQIACAFFHDCISSRCSASRSRSNSRKPTAQPSQRRPRRLQLRALP